MNQLKFDKSWWSVATSLSKTVPCRHFGLCSITANNFLGHFTRCGINLEGLMFEVETVQDLYRVPCLDFEMCLIARSISQRCLNYSCDTKLSPLTTAFFLIVLSIGKSADSEKTLWRNIPRAGIKGLKKCFTNAIRVFVLCWHILNSRLHTFY